MSELHDLAAAAALGALSDEDARALAAATTADEQLAADAAAYAATVEALERVLPRTSPPPGLLDRVLAEVGALEQQAAPEPAPEPASVVSISAARRRRGRGVVVLAAALSAAAAAALTYVVVAPSGLGEPEAVAAIAAADPALPVSGTARLYDPGAPDGRLVVDLAKVPPAPSGHHYEVWVLRRGAEQMESVGAFAPAGTSARLELPLPGAGDYAAVDISVEENDGPAEHSETSLGGAAFA